MFDISSGDSVRHQLGARGIVYMLQKGFTNGTMYVFALMLPTRVFLNEQQIGLSCLDTRVV